MATIRMSVSEIRRVGGWALRALDYPFGIAERAAGLVAWSEATGGRALRLLRLADARIACSAALPAAIRRRKPTGGWLIEAGGKCLLEIGPPAIDLATTDARRHGTGHVEIAGHFGGCMIGALVNMAVERGLTALAIHRAGVGEDALAPAGTSGWVAGWPGTGAPVFARADGIAEGAALSASVERLCLTPFAPVASPISEFAARKTGRPGLSQAGLAIFLVADGAMSSGVDSLAPLVDYSAQIADAHRQGIVVDRDEFLHFYALERRSWAPTSEKSRKQAAF